MNDKSLEFTPKEESETLTMLPTFMEQVLDTVEKVLEKNTEMQS